MGHAWNGSTKREKIKFAQEAFALAKEANIDDETLAGFLGVTEQTLDRWRRGKSHPSFNGEKRELILKTLREEIDERAKRERGPDPRATDKTIKVSLNLGDAGRVTVDVALDLAAMSGEELIALTRAAQNEVLRRAGMGGSRSAA